MSPDAGLRAGFIGLGNIGRPMAERLVQAGISTTVYDVADAPVRDLAAAGARAATSARDLASRCDVIGLCVRDDDDVRRALLDEDGILAGASEGTVVAVHSTILPRTVQEMGAAARERGVGLVDACITGGAMGARAGTLTMMAGGDDDDIERCRPIFEAQTQQIVHTGALGTGAATKLCNNLMTYLGFAAAFEATLLARHAGLSQEALEQVTRSNGNMSDQMLAFLALHKVPDETRNSEGFQQTVRNFADLGEKDLAVTLAFARESGVALPATGLCQQLMARIYGLHDDRRR